MPFIGPVPEKLVPFKRIVDEQQARKVPVRDKDGKKRQVLIDGCTANAILLVYEALNPENKEKFLSCDPLKMGLIAWKFVKFGA